MAEDQKTVAALSAKELKKLAKPEFAADPDKFYPTSVFAEFEFERGQCPKCNEHFWSFHGEKELCGDSNCVGKYSFIGKKTGIGKKGHVTLEMAYKNFENHFSNEEVPCTPIDRYPVVARWRADVDYVAAGIFCFQPYCVTGELEPPAPALICPQPCLRFNDLDCIGLTGRHFSCFTMLGIQTFNTPDRYVFFHEETVRFNLRWLTQSLEIDPREITLIEDVWAGGGNLGPCVEYFIGGLELGNMVGIQFKTFPDGSREQLTVKVIDVGIGLERIPWLLNGSPTSYCDVFPTVLARLQEATGLAVTNEVWDKFGPYSCLLNADEVEGDIENVWAGIAEQIGDGITSKELQDAIMPVRDMYLVADHTRTVLIAVRDGSLPSNVGGAANLRNVLRRVFSILHKRNWFEPLGGLDGLLALFHDHEKDLEGTFGKFEEYKSFDDIIRIEYERWQTTDNDSKTKLDRLVKKGKGTLSLDDWILASSSYGIDPDRISELTGLAVPGTLYYEIALRQEKSAKVAATQLYDTASWKHTNELFYDEATETEMTGAKVVAVVPNVEQDLKTNIVVLDGTSFYPTSGGQEHDTGVLTIDGKKLQVVDVTKVGGVIFHIVAEPITEDLVGKTADGAVDIARRDQLRSHHTAAHIISAACRDVLGPHIWQAGAKKTTQQAHLDITHYQSLSREEEVAIETAANRIVNACIDIERYVLAKDEAEKQHGFKLYQGGVVPGNQLRIVDIPNTDVEACCGTHAHATGEVGCIRLVKTQRISDGVVRITFTAGERSIATNNQQAELIHTLTSSWGCTDEMIIDMGDQFFTNHKKLKKQVGTLFQTQMRLVALDEPANVVIRTDADAGTFAGGLAAHSELLQARGKNVVFVAPTFFFGLLGKPDAFDHKSLEPLVQKQVDKLKEKDENAVDEKKAKKLMNERTKLSFTKKEGKKKTKVVVENVVEFQSQLIFQAQPIIDHLVAAGFVELEL